MQGVSASCCLVLPQRGLLFAGLSDGKILAWDSDRYLVVEGVRGVRAAVFMMEIGRSMEAIKI